MTTESTLPTAERGDQIEVIVPEDMCWVPVELMDQYPATNYMPCSEIPAPVVEVGLPPVPETTVAVVGTSDPLMVELPETGPAFTLGLIFLAIAFISGGYLLWSWARDTEDIDDYEG